MQPHGPGDLQGVGVDEELVGVEAMAPRWRVGAVDPVAVELARPDIGEEGVPHEVRPLRHPHPLGLDPIGRIVEEAELDAGRVPGKQGEVDSHAVPGRPERCWPAGPQPWAGAGDGRALRRLARHGVRVTAVSGQVPETGPAPLLGCE